MKLGLKFGFKMLLRNPVRVAASLLAAIAAFGIAGMCIFMQNYDTLPWERELYFDYCFDFLNPTEGLDPYVGIVWSDDYITQANQWNGVFSADQLVETEAAISDLGGYAIMRRADINSVLEIKTIHIPELYKYINCGETRLWGEHNGETLFAPYPADLDFEFPIDFNETKEKLISHEIYRSMYQMLTVYSGDDAMQAFGYELVGKLPTQIDEVAIPQWLYNCFLCYGYKDREGNVYQIDREEDIIGKTLPLYSRQFLNVCPDLTCSATIVGVVHTDYASENIPERIVIREEGQESAALTIENYASMSLSAYTIPPHFGVVVSRAFLDSELDRFPRASCIVVPRDQDYSGEYFDRFHASYRAGKTIPEIDREEMSGAVEEAPRLAYSQAITHLVIDVRAIYADASIYFRIVPYLGVFAAILLAYLCFSTVMGRRRGVGTLQSLGAGKKQIALAVGIPIFVFCLIASLGALCVEIGFLSAMNVRLTQTMMMLQEWYGYVVTADMLPYPFILGWETLLFTFGVPLAIAAVATLVTVWLVFRTPVVDNLNKKEFRLFSKKAR